MMAKATFNVVAILPGRTQDYSDFLKRTTTVVS